jgi:hypothetical protein
MLTTLASKERVLDFGGTRGAIPSGLLWLQSRERGRAKGDGTGAIVKGKGECGAR